MIYIQGKDRFQTEFATRCLDETVGADNEVRRIDAFVNLLDLTELGFRTDHGHNGRPAYDPADLLKLYIYGYLNRNRSSRDLEAECVRNLEVIWLLRGLTPDHNTINRFRKDHPDAIRAVFKATVQLAKYHQLIGGKLLAGDSTKLRAQNSKKNNFNHKKIQRHLQYIDEKLDAFMTQLDDADGDLEPAAKKEIRKKIRQHKVQRKRYESLQKQLDASGEDQISTSDPDSRQLIIRGQITEVAYNVQSTVDDKHNLPIDFEVTNNNDSKAMGAMLERAAEELGHSDFTALFDKGYHTTSEFVKAHELGAEVIVAQPATASHAPNTRFDVEHFTYNAKKDQYRCPAGRILRTNGTWYHNKDKNGRFKQYKTTACKECIFATACTTSRNGRVIQRNEHAHLIEQNKARLLSQADQYKRRQAIVEHPFGTIKRQWGFDHVMTKQTLKNASADVGLIFIAYNLRRIFSILPEHLLRKAFHSPKSRLKRVILDLIQHLKGVFEVNFNPINHLQSFMHI